MRILSCFITDHDLSQLIGEYLRKFPEDQLLHKIKMTKNPLRRISLEQLPSLLQEVPYGLLLFLCYGSNRTIEEWDELEAYYAGNRVRIMTGMVNAHRNIMDTTIHIPWKRSTNTPEETAAGRARLRFLKSYIANLPIQEAAIAGTDVVMDRMPISGDVARLYQEGWTLKVGYVSYIPILEEVKDEE